jgi:hypothetical protein
VVPLAAGATSTPVGVAHVFSTTYPDLFVVTSKNSLEQGIFLYEFLELDGAPLLCLPHYCCKLNLKSRADGIILAERRVLEKMDLYAQG